MTNDSWIKIQVYYPAGVKRLLTRCAGNWIGVVDESTILKYPLTDDHWPQIRAEAEMLEVLGDHPRVVKSKGLTEAGILLEYAPNGDLYEYFAAHPDIPLDLRLLWCVQLAEAMVYIHSKRIIHCDIRHRNLLLDADLNLKLCDFQGRLLSADGDYLLNGDSIEGAKTWLPRPPPDSSTYKTDLFAVGSTIYYIMMGHEVFPELDGHKYEDEVEIERRFRAGEFPTDTHLCDAITDKCWRQKYDSAQDLFDDLVAIQSVANGTAQRETVPPC